MEKRNILSVARGSTAGCRRAAWRIISSVEQEENLEADDAKQSPKIVPQDRILQGTVEQILDVLVLEKAERLAGSPADRISRRKPAANCGTYRRWRNWQSSSRLSLRTGFNCVSEDRSLKTPAIPLAEKIVEVPVIQTEEKTRQGVNMCVQHVVNAVEEEKSEIIELTVQRMKPIIQEKIN